MKAHLFSTDDTFSKDYKPGFKFRGLNDESIFFDENHTRMTQNYRNAYLRLAIYYVNQDKKQLAIQALDKMEERLPRDILKMEFGLTYELSNIYYRAGGYEQYNKLAAEVEKEAWERINKDPGFTNSYWDPYMVLLNIYDNQKNFKMSYEIWNRLSTLYPGDPTVKMNLEKYKALAANQDTSRLK
jgi:tetratricopeptide (TPR) repeat protein